MSSLKMTFSLASLVLFWRSHLRTSCDGAAWRMPTVPYRL